LSVTIATDAVPSDPTPKIKARLLSAYRLIDPSRREEPILTLNWRNSKTQPIGTLIGSRLSQTEINNLSVQDFKSIRNRLLSALQEVEKRINLEPSGSDATAIERIQPLLDAGTIAFKIIFQSYDLRDDISRLIYMARVRGRLPIIRIMTDGEHLIPWDLIYAGYLDWHRDAEKKISQFLGMGCVVEHMLPGLDAINDVKISNIDKTLVSIVRNPSVIHPQENEMRLMADTENAGRLAVVERDKRGNEIDLKNFLEQPAHIIQFVAHGIPDEASPVLNQLDFGDGAISPYWLNDWRVKFRDQPFIIMNACEGLHSIPDLYGSFLKAFLDCGARGVLGSLVPIKALFASRFTTNFYEDFLNGRSAGEALYFARWNCWDKSKSLLGLLYIYYGSLYIHLQNSTRTKKLDVCSACLISRSCASNAII
jgi:hypothetical protein